MEQIQLVMVDYLRVILSEHHSAKELHFFTKIMDLFISMRDLTEIYMTEYETACKDELIAKELPLLLEFL